MASANVQLVRSIFAAWERGDFSSAEWGDSEIEFVQPEGPGPVSRRGLAGMAEGWRDWLSAWKDFRVEAEEFRELDDVRSLAEAIRLAVLATLAPADTPTGNTSR